MKKSLNYFFIICLLCFPFISCSNQNGNGKDYKSNEEPLTFISTSLTDESEITFENYKGRPTVFNFWASWCVPCREEMPFLEENWNKLKNQGVNLVGVNVQDSKKEALKVIEKYSITYTNLYDPKGELSRKFDVLGLPATIFVNSEGKVIRQNYGPFIGIEGEKSFNEYLGDIQ